MRTLLVTGAAGFIGSNFVLSLRRRRAARVVTLDKLTYAGNRENLGALHDDPDHLFVRGDIADAALTARLLAEHRPAAVVNFAAESHVDRSISGPAPFIETNVSGTFRLLQAVREYREDLSPAERDAFRFLHVSTDEVFGSLSPDDPPFSESSPAAPNSPYAASKAAGDHLVRAWNRTFGLPTLTVNCSNNYGPFQFPEKLIPLAICHAREGRPIPLYGDGLQVRDWLYVEDHCRAIEAVLDGGDPGETYNVGGRAERTNRDLLAALCAVLDDRLPGSPHVPHGALVTPVADRPGHDRRYAIDDTKIRTELGWSPAETLESGLARTVDWYLAHPEWIDQVRSGAYRQWMTDNYAHRLPFPPAEENG